MVLQLYLPLHPKTTIMAQSILERNQERRRLTDLTFKSEDGNVFLFDFMMDSFYDVFEYETENIMNLAVINELITYYIETGGKEAGEYVEAAPNFLKYINKHYDFLKEQFIYKKTNDLFNQGGFYWFLINEYQTYISINHPEPLN